LFTFMTDLICPQYKWIRFCLLAAVSLVNEIIRALETKEHRGAHEYAPKLDILCFL